jgi:hypothetical protein
MSVISDMSDEGLVRQFGDVLFEIPELFEALRHFELQNRPRSLSGGFKVKSDSVSVERGRGMFRIQVGNPRSMK